MKIVSVAFIFAIIMAACNEEASRPAPLDPTPTWVRYCAQRPNCGLCASQSNCAFCSNTNTCVYYSASDPSAKISCPNLIQQPALCK